MIKTKQKINFLTALWRIVKLFFHFIYGVMLAFFFIRYQNEENKAKNLQKWSKKLLEILDITLDIPNTFPKQLENTLLAINHISWLDVLIVFTIIKPRFVAKKEINNWPIIGWLTRIGKTIFIDRENKRSIMQVNQSLAIELSKGSCIAIFPEGTTSEGKTVLPFKASLFEPIYQSKGNVLPIAIQYKDYEGHFYTRPAFVGKISLLKSVWRVLTCYQLTVVVNHHDFLDTKQYSNRNDLAKDAHQAIYSYWSS